MIRLRLIRTLAKPGPWLRRGQKLPGHAAGFAGSGPAALPLFFVFVGVFLVTGLARGLLQA